MDLGSNVLQQVRERGPPVAMEMTKPDQYSRLRPLNCNPSPKFPSLPPIFGIILPHLSIYPSIHLSIHLSIYLNVLHMLSPPTVSSICNRQPNLAVHLLKKWTTLFFTCSYLFIHCLPNTYSQDPAH